MSHISHSTIVFSWVFHPPMSGQRAWLTSYENVRNTLGELVIVPHLDDDPANAMSMPYETALILKRRIESENVIHSCYEVHFSLHPTGEEVAANNKVSRPFDDSRMVMAYRGLLVRPGIDVNRGRCWFVKFPGTAIESVRGDTPEQAVDLVYERNLQSKAEQAPQQPAPPEPPQPKNTGPRVRPGDLI